MMDISRVALFGHRVIDNLFAVENALEKLLTDIIQQNSYVDFFVGRNGDFDILATSIIHKIRRNVDGSNSSLNLVLPYMTKEYEDNSDSFNNYYSDVEILFDERTHPKSAIGKRNKYMVENADLIVCFVTHKGGGAWEAVQYAERLSIPVVNVADIIYSDIT